MEEKISAEEIAKKQNEILLEALNKIAFPIKYFQQEAEKEGAQLDGHNANELANNAHWLRDIAGKAIEQYNAAQFKQQSAGVWVKASERLPESKGTYKVVGLNNQREATPPHDIWFTGTFWAIRSGCSVTYWLDESQQSQPQSSLTDDDKKVSIKHLARAYALLTEKNNEIAELKAALTNRQQD